MVHYILYIVFLCSYVLKLLCLTVADLNYSGAMAPKVMTQEKKERHAQRREAKKSSKAASSVAPSDHEDDDEDLGRTAAGTVTEYKYEI